VSDPISVSINEFASKEELEGVEEAFRSAGIEVEVEANYFMKSADAVPWIVLVSVGFAAGGFFRGYFGKLGADAATKTQEWVRALRKARESSPALPGSVVIKDANRNTVVLGDPPLEAYENCSSSTWTPRTGRTSSGTMSGENGRTARPGKPR
jgi:hypothetical protein